jgi:hypothetical protein
MGSLSYSKKGTSIEEVSVITKENPMVLIDLDNSKFHIITKYLCAH